MNLAYDSKTDNVPFADMAEGHFSSKVIKVMIKIETARQICAAKQKEKRAKKTSKDTHSEQS